MAILTGDIGEQPQRRGIRPLLAIAFLIAVCPPVGHAAGIGTERDRFTPSPGGNGRGIAVQGSTSSLAYYSTYGSGGDDKIYVVDLKSHAFQRTIDTNLAAVDPGHSFGALSWDATNGRLWAATYAGNRGAINRVDVGTGQVTPVFDSHDADISNVGIDGLAIDADGSMWVSGDGLGRTAQGGTTLFHFTSAGTLLGAFPVAFGNSGIAIDGDDLWLADIDGRTIHKYSKAGVDSGVSFATPGIDPEGITIDSCSFPGKKALWTYSSAFAGGEMVAYEIGSSSNAGCQSSADPRQKNPADKHSDDIYIGGDGGGTAYAGESTLFDLTSPSDPFGIIFTYTWDLGDGVGIYGPGIYGGVLHYAYQCAGFYSVTASIHANGSTYNFLRSIVVNFPSSTANTYSGLRVSPSVSAISPRRVRLSLDVSKLATVSPPARITTVDYKVDKQSFKGRTPSGVKAKVRTHRNHTLTITAHLKYRRARNKITITTCFYY